MKAFYQEYMGLEHFITQSGKEKSNHSISPHPVAKFDKVLSLITELPWGHNSILIEIIWNLGIWGQSKII